MTKDKKKITDIFEEKSFIRKEKNEYGQWQETEKVFRRKRPVNSLLPPMRFFHFFIDVTILSVIQLPFVIYNFISPVKILEFIPLLLFFAYYILFEFYFQQTIGKFLTKSIVVDEYGEKPDFKTICLRTVARIVPFEPFSFFWQEEERWWHDTWTKTYVISKEELLLIKKIGAGEKQRRTDKERWDEWHSWQQG